MMNKYQFYKYFQKKSGTDILFLKENLTAGVQKYKTIADYKNDTKGFNELYFQTFNQLPTGCTTCGGSKKLEGYIKQLNNALIALNSYIDDKLISNQTTEETIIVEEIIEVDNNTPEITEEEVFEEHTITEISGETFSKRKYNRKKKSDDLESEIA